MYFNNNMGGRGFMFNEEEAKKALDHKNIFKHQFNLQNDIEDNDDNEDIFNTNRELTEAQKRELVRADRKTQKMCLQMIQNPEAKAQVMQAATRAAKEAILNGQGTDEVLF